VFIFLPEKSFTNALFKPWKDPGPEIFTSLVTICETAGFSFGMIKHVLCPTAASFARRFTMVAQIHSLDTWNFRSVIFFKAV
jgi:hypothetical protein